MGGVWVFDLETNGLLDREDGLAILCAAAENVDTGELVRFGPEAHLEPVHRLPQFLDEATETAGHNIARFDLPLLERLFPGWTPRAPFVDTIVASRLIFGATMYERSLVFRNRAGKSEAQREARFPSRLLASHSLESWGFRLGFGKGEFLSGVDDFETMEYSPELLAYCARDVALNAKLYRYLLAAGTAEGWPPPSRRSIELESRVAYLVGKMERNGVGFDDDSALELESQLRERQTELVRELRYQFPPWYEAAGEVVPKRSATSRKVSPGEGGYRNVSQGCAYTKVVPCEFNPASGKHVERALRSLGWKPKEFGADGVARADEETLVDLPYPCVKQILEFQLVSKRLGALSDGANAWRKLVEGGRIFGRCQTLGTRTTRMSHARPNLSQVPAVGKPYGDACRRLFGPTRPGWVMVGADASGLQLRALAHRLAAYDGGAFRRDLLEGDPHSTWQAATGLFSRRHQKTYTYAMLFGAGNGKLGSIVLEDWRDAYADGVTREAPPSADFAEKLGERTRAKLAAKVAGLEELLASCAACYARGNPLESNMGSPRGRRRRKRRGYGWLLGLDGRTIPVRSEHGALNDLLQSDEAVIMKTALVLLDELLEGWGWRLGTDYAPLLFVHDEMQYEARPELADELGVGIVASIRRAGRELNYRCPLDGEYKVGANWAETH